MKRVLEYAEKIAVRKINGGLKCGKLYQCADGMISETVIPKTPPAFRIFENLDHIFFDYSREIYRELRKKQGISAKRATWEFHN